MESRLPPWAADEAPSPHDVPGHRDPIGSGVRRVPGLPAQAELRRGATKGAGKGTTATATSAARTATTTTRPDARPDPRLSAPGVLDPPIPSALACDLDDLDDADDDGDHGQQSWAKVVRRGRRPAKTQDDGRPPPGTPVPPQYDGDAPPPDPNPPVLPPPLIVERPKAPRRAIVSRRQAQIDRIERLEADGASPAKLRKAREGLQEIERELRLAGGATERALSFSIKSGDDSVEKARRALAKAREDKQARLELRESIDKALQEDDVRIERLEQRHKAALEKRLYHVESKRAECVSERTIGEYRSAIAQLAVSAATNPALAAVQSLLQRELDLMAPPQVDIDIAEGDTTSDTDPETDDEVARRSPLPSAAAEPVDTTNSSGRYAEQLSEARKKLERITTERRAAIHNAEAHATRAAKRSLGADGGKSQEIDGDEPMSAVLTVDRVKELYHRRLADAAEEVDHLARMAAREEIPVLPTDPCTTQRPRPPPTQPNTNRRSRPPSPQRTPCPPKPAPQALVELARGADEEMQEVHDEVAAERREEARLDRIDFQERMQRQQEIEQIQAELTERRLAAARAAAAAAGREVEAALDARLRAERAPTPVAEHRSSPANTGGGKLHASRWSQAQPQAARGRHPAELRGKSEDGFIVSAARRRADGDDASTRERSPRLRQSDMSTS